MTTPHDRQLELQLNQLGEVLASQAPAALPPEVCLALGRKRRTIWARRVALAAAFAFVAGGTVVVYFAARSLTPALPPGPIVDPRQPDRHPVPEICPVEPNSPHSIASLRDSWKRTGDIDPPITSRTSEPTLRAGDLNVPGKLETVASPWQ